MSNFCSNCGTALAATRSIPTAQLRKASKKPKITRKATASQKRYGREFKKLQSKYKKKSGGWKKDGFKRCAAAARRASK